MLDKKFQIPLEEIYHKNLPYPHIEIKNMWDVDMLNNICNEFLNFKNWDGEKTFYGAKSKKFCYSLDKLPKNTLDFISYLNSSAFIKVLEKITGDKNLIADPNIMGGGMASIGRGGFLKMHADFSWHENLKLYRKINVLIYLNKNWDENWGGDLKLASKKDGKLSMEKNYFPHFNSTVIFTTNNETFHGHPDPLKCPDNISRNSISTYYYVKERPFQGYENKRTSTDYRSEKGKKIVRDPLLKILVKDPFRAIRWLMRKIGI